MFESKSCITALYRISGLLVIFLLSVFPALGQVDTVSLKQQGQKSQKEKNYLSLFTGDEILEVFIRCNLNSFLEKTARNNSFDGVMRIPLGGTDSLDRKVTIKYRGTSRYERCKFPPMKIIFKKPIYEASDSGRIKKMKLVNQCDRGSLNEEYVIRECLVYKLYSVLTDTSFRVRLIKVNFIDTQNKKKPLIQYGIFIEPEELLAKRTNTMIVKAASLTQRDIFPAMMDRIAIFNYMISNWDWSIPGQHNVVVLKSTRYEVAGLGIPVPFDFDLSGVVNAEYAIPPEGLGIETNRDRLFTGICRPREVYQKDLIMFLNKKQEFYSVINDYPYLKKSAKNDIIILLDQFFNQLEKQRNLDMLINTFLEKCKKL